MNMNRRGGPMGGGRGGRGGFGGPGRGGRGGPMGPGPMGGRGGGGGGGGGNKMSHYGPASNAPPPHMMGGRGGGPMGMGPPGRGMGPGPMGPGRGMGPGPGGRGMGGPGPMGPGRGGGGGPPMGHYGPQNPMPPPPPPNGNFSPGMHRHGHGHGHGHGGPMMQGGRGPPPPPPRGPPGRGPMGPGPGPDFGRNHNMMGHQHHNQQGQGGPPPPPPPPRQGHPNQINNGPPHHMMGGHPNQGPSFNNGPPQHMQMNQPHNNMNPQMQMQQGPHPGPPGMPPNQQMHPNQPPFQQNGGPPPNMRMPNQPPYEQGYPQQQQNQMQMNPQMNQPPPMGGPQHPQYQQQPPPQSMQHNMQQPPPGMSPHQQRYPPNQQPSPQAMQQPPPSVLRNTPNQQPQSQQNVQQQRQPHTAGAASSPAKNAEAAWTEHSAPSGVPYYYNTVTGVSTYERPAALGGAASTASTPVKEATPAAKASTPASSKSKWQTYTDEKTGKKYYSDGKTTTWSRPAEMPPEEEEKPKSKRGVSFQEETAPRKKKKSNDSKGDTVSLYANKAEAIAAFKGLLLAKDVAPTTKWNDVVRICQDDARWEACATAGERKQALAEYQTKRANELRDVKRQEKVRTKEAYQRLLTDVLPNDKKFTPGQSRFMDVRDSLSKDDRFYAVEDETTREELFYEWVEELRKKDERSKRNKRREAKEGCIKFFKSREEEGKLTFASTWSSFMSSLDEAEKSDSRFSVSPHMSDSDRQLYFSDHVIELQNAEDEKRRRIRDARRRAEKAQRDAFRDKLTELAKSGVVTPETRWRGIEEKVSSQFPNVFEPVQAQGREVAREMFEDFVYDWKEEYRRDKVTLSRVWESSSKKKEFSLVDKKVTAEDFCKLLLESSAGSPDLYGDIRRISNRENPVSSISLFFNELRADAETSKNGHGKKRGSMVNGDVSSEDEGEIIEDGEVAEKEV